MMMRNLKTVFLLTAVSAVTAFGDMRPAPSPAQLSRIESGFELYGIVHWGLNTYTDREWGFGDENPKLLAPDAFDAGQIVRACRDGGLQGLIVVAKHHDGFCLWPTRTTEHNISKSPFRGGKGDYVREMSEACSRYGLKFGVYCSPWDRNSAHYATERYVDIFHAQIKELLDGRYGEIFEMWFDGANGGDGYYGGARERRKISSGYYRFDKVFQLVRKLQPMICIFNEDDKADYRWPGNERGMLDPDSRATGAHFDISRYNDYRVWSNTGVHDGICFHPPEADFPLRPGWFYHASQRGKTKSGAYLMQRYLNTVGNGGSMNVGVAPDKRGLLCDEDVSALKNFGVLKKAFFSREVAEGLCNVVVLKEDVSRGERVDEWRLDSCGETLLAGKSIGIKRIRILPRRTAAETLRLNVKGKSKVQPRLLPISAYLVDDELLELIRSVKVDSGETDTAKWMEAQR
jgi:alpha-L-fucosidase